MGRNKSITIILTGGPGSGKTTLLRKMRELGFATVDEPAEVVLNFMASFLGSDQAQADWRRATSNHIDWLQDKILRVASVQKDITKKLGGGSKKQQRNVIFFDRGLHDSLTYFKIHKRKVPPSLALACRKARYDLILVLETPPEGVFAPKAGRNTTLREDSVAMGQLLFELYSKDFPGKTLLVPWSRNRAARVVKMVKTLFP